MSAFSGSTTAIQLMTTGSKTVERLVVDTNVLISAALSKRGAPYKLMHALFGRAQIVFTQETFAEFESRLWRPKFDAYLNIDERRQLLHNAENMAHWVNTPAEIKSRCFCRDPDDDKFIHAAQAADCRWLVSGDADLLSLNPLDDLRLVSANDALNQIPWLEHPSSL